jgi:putative hemolysin
MLIILILIGLLILVDGFFASTEMALVTACQTRWRILADRGDQQATKVLTVQEKTSDYLATAQIGITLLATAAPAVGGAQFVHALSPYIYRINGLAPYGDEIALAMVILAITLFTLVFGELVPKGLAIENAENLAQIFIGPISLLSRRKYLPIRVHSNSADKILRLKGN